MITQNGSDDAPVTVLFAHGAGADKDHEFMQDMADRLAVHNIRVIRFNFPYMNQRALTGKKYPPDRAPKLLAEFEQQIEQHADVRPLFLAGKSMGGRMASHLAEHAKVTGVMCLGFPFHPPKKPQNNQPKAFRGDHLANIEKPVLILQGERDTFGTKQECEQFEFSASVEIEFIPDGDHGLKPRVKSGYTEDGNRDLAVERMVQFIQTHAYS